MNKFADLSAVEFAALYMGLVVPEDNLVAIFFKFIFVLLIAFVI